MAKNSAIKFRITDEEKSDIKATAKKHGHDTEGGFLMWLHRRFKRGERLKTLAEKIKANTDE